MKFLNFTLIISALYVMPVYGYDWPLEPDTSQHKIVSVMGECREVRDTFGIILDSIDHFHRGIDIPALSGTPVYAIDGDTCYISGSGINIGHFRYYHMTEYLYPDSSFVLEGAAFANTNEDNHVHLQEADVKQLNISEYTRHSLTRRAINWVYCEPKSMTAIISRVYYRFKKCP